MCTHGYTIYYEGSYYLNVSYDYITHRIYMVRGTANDYFAAFQVDFDNKNITTIYPATQIDTSNRFLSFMSHWDNLFFNRVNGGYYGSSVAKILHRYYNPTTNSLGSTTNICASLPTYSSSSADILLDMACNDGLGRIFLAVLCGGTHYILRMDRAADGIYYLNPLYATIPDTVKADTLIWKGYENNSSGPYYTSTLTEPAMNITAGGTIMYITADGVFKQQILDTDTMTLTEIDMPIRDGLDKTKVTAFKLSKDGMFLYLKTSDEAYAEAERTRCYAYQFGGTDTFGYHFIGVPSLFFDPATLSGALPYARPSTLIDNEHTIYATTSKLAQVYAVKAIRTAGADYSIVSCNNTFSSEHSKYAVATEDLDTGTVGKGLLILS